ncbi:MAG: glutamate formimidoyltransferase [Syntrophobacterales bacterium]|jgi:glutamate formiminotransferase|nr:glutamate formimidoyltransferase [Syntrophobacterales bacterium]
MKIIECVPNISEGRNAEIITVLAEVIRNTDGVKLLHVNADADHNRSVLTFIGTPETIIDGVLRLCQEALARIDMRFHEGIHPRMGAVDVVPFVPLGDAVLADAVSAAHRFGHLAADKMDVPVYFYGEAALKEERRHLAHVRRGGYEALPAKMQRAAERPDRGEPVFHPRRGAMAVGARKPLIAFNVNLDTTDLELAKKIASSVRASSGGFAAVMAIGLFLETKGCVQVSMNLTDYEKTSIKTVYDYIAERAAQNGVAVLHSELIGLTPCDAMKNARPDYLKLIDFNEERLIEFHLGRCLCEAGIH